MKPSYPGVNATPVFSPTQPVNYLNPLDPNFNFDLWASLVGQRMRAVVRQQG